VCVVLGSLVRSVRMRALPGHRGAAVLTAALLIAAGLWAVAYARASGPTATAATTLKASEHVSLKLVKRTGSTKFEHAGRASGTVAGSVRAKITLTHAVVLNGTVTITTSRGRLYVKVSGRARSLELRTRFSGSATMAGGTGRYAHARGAGTFKGVVNRSTWAATIDATGSLTY
jgi:hypothetical protein